MFSIFFTIAISTAAIFAIKAAYDSHLELKALREREIFNNEHKALSKMLDILR